MLATVIGPLLSLLLIVSPHLAISSDILGTLQTVLAGGITSFFDSAVYFALAIEIATTTILVAKDYESTAIAFGDYETRISTIACAISLLPLTYPIIILPNRRSPCDKDTRDKEAYRKCLFCIAVLASVYPFFSQSVRTWAPTQIGDARGDGGVTYVDADEWDVVGKVCFGTVEYLTDTENTTIGAFQMVASLFVILFCIFMLVPPTLRRLNYRYGEDSHIRKAMTAFCDRASQACQQSPLKYILLAVPVCLAAPLLWGFWRIRTLQTQLATATGREYEGNEWGFGQVMAITIFAPVAAEMIFEGIRGRRPAKVEHGSYGNGTQERSQNDSDTHWYGEASVSRRGMRTWDL